MSMEIYCSDGKKLTKQDLKAIEDFKEYRKNRKKKRKTKLDKEFQAMLLTGMPLKELKIIKK